MRRIAKPLPLAGEACPRALDPGVEVRSTEGEGEAAWQSCTVTPRQPHPRRSRAATSPAPRARFWILLLLALFATFPAGAVEPSERLANPVLEARARAISETLRCLVCQNESIDESNAGLAHDIRVLLRERIAAGDTDAQATQAIVNRYGDFVLLNPPVRPATYVLWFGPPALLLVGLIGTVIWLRRRPASIEAAAPLSPAEQSRLDAMLQEADR